VQELIVITDYFVIASGTSDRQVRTIADEVERVLAERGSKAVRREGRSDGRWVLLDFVDLVVHIFVTEERQYYELERLWSDAPRLRWEQRGRTGTRRATSRPDKAG
jgi:ribosome-associated protein